MYIIAHAAPLTYIRPPTPLPLPQARRPSVLENAGQRQVQQEA